MSQETPQNQDKALETLKPRKVRTSKTNLERGRMEAPTELATIGDVKNEIARVYKLVFYGKLRLSEASRLTYMLGNLSQAIKAEVEISALQAGYVGAWSGINIITPVKNPNQKVIEHEPE